MGTKKLFRITILIFLTAIVFYSQFYYVDFKYKCAILLIPDFQPSNLSTRETLKFLKKSSPENYLNTCARVNIIDKKPSCGGLDGGCYQVDSPKTIYIGNDQNNLALAAAIVIHETCHAKQGQEHRNISEAECYTEGARYLKEVTIIK